MSHLEAQSCTDVLRKSAAVRTKQVVSVQELAIPDKAWQHMERARAAMDANQPEIFARETEQALAIAPQFASTLR